MSFNKVIIYTCLFVGELWVGLSHCHRTVINSLIASWRTGHDFLWLTALSYCPLWRKHKGRGSVGLVALHLLSQSRQKQLNTHWCLTCFLQFTQFKIPCPSYSPNHNSHSSSCIDLQEIKDNPSTDMYRAKPFLINLSINSIIIHISNVNVFISFSTTVKFEFYIQLKWRPP